MSASFISGSDGWVLGDTASCPATPCTSVLRTRDGGRNWQGIPAPRASLGADLQHGQVRSIRFATAKDGWIFGPQLWATHDGGTTWRRVRPGGQSVAVGSVATGGGSVYLSSAVCPTMNGDSCSRQTSVYAAAIDSNHFSELATVPDTDEGSLLAAAQVTVHGADWFLPTASAVYHGLGRHHPHRMSPACAAKTDTELAAADSTHLDALCVSRDGAGQQQSAQLRGSTNGGQTWSDAGRQTYVPDDVAGISDNGAGSLILAASGADSEILRTTDDGHTFATPLRLGTGGTQWSDGGFTTSSQAFAVLYRSRMYVSHTAGARWTPVTF